MIKVLFIIKPIGYSRMEISNQVSLMETCVNLSDLGKRFMQQFYPYFIVWKIALCKETIHILNKVINYSTEQDIAIVLYFFLNSVTRKIKEK
ncbi:hypothetical protein CK516_37620 [Nostoc sp. 'Peltigera malacea cyanobiont' DB3992]|nr:hypothetical protein CK516_37620 [Nostoc sp. 'Peltigera malacea cyanobiont' DB3992]